MSMTVWKDEFVIRAYELAKGGQTETVIAKALGISLGTFFNWERKKSVFRTALKEARERSRDGHLNFADYVYRRLSPELRNMWDKIQIFDKTKNGVERIEALLANRGVTIRQHLFLYAWTSSNFSLSRALRKVNISRCTFENWKNNDPDFAKLVEEINWHKKNFMEDALLTLISAGDSSSTIFANKTYNRDRGYGEAVKVDVNVQGQIAHYFIPIDELNLPLTVRKIILSQVRKRKEIESKLMADNNVANSEKSNGELCHSLSTNTI